MEKISAFKKVDVALAADAIGGRDSAMLFDAPVPPLNGRAGGGDGVTSALVDKNVQVAVGHTGGGSMMLDTDGF
jgi:hypothetical protein